jgi:hypothetical protein
MCTNIDVYLKTISLAQDFGEFRHAGQHTYCAPGMMHGIRGTQGFRGRILTPDSTELLPELDHARETLPDQIDSVDVACLRGWLKALRAGI